MEISSGIDILGTALWIKREKIFIINDLHLGYEEALQRKGILVPKFQLQEIKKEIKSILERVAPATIIINGDLKHEFGTVLRQEWKEVLEFLDLVLSYCKNVVVIRGNHDPLLKFIAEKRGVEVVPKYSFGDTLIVHGDELVQTDKKRLIIGHEHPAITIREKSKREKYKCFLKGRWYQKASLSGTSGKERLFQKKGKELIAVPSFNPLLEGTDVLKEELLSPFLTNIKNFEVYVVGQGEVFRFGKVKDVK